MDWTAVSALLIVFGASWGAVWSFLSPIASGTVTAVVWVLLVFFYLLWRNWCLDKKIRQSLRNIKPAVWPTLLPEGSLKNNFGFEVRNDTHVPITVRMVETVFRDANGLALPSRLVPGGPAETHVAQDVSDERNFVEMPAYTGSRWGHSSRKQILENHRRYVCLRITAHYLTLLKTPKLIQVEIPASDSRFLHVITTILNAPVMARAAQEPRRPDGSL